MRRFSAYMSTFYHSEYIAMKHKIEKFIFSVLQNSFVTSTKHVGSRISVLMFDALATTIFPNNF